MTEALPEDMLPQTPLPANELGRLEALRRYNILDTPPEVAFDRITALAARLFDIPIALVSLIDQSRGWFKSAYGFNLQEVQRDATICSLALLSDEVLVIPDTRQDARLACNPFVQSEPGLRFYAGAPLLTQDGFNLGTLCLLDTKPRDALTDEQQRILSDLAAMVMDELELRLAARKVAQIDTALLEVTQGVSAATGEAFFYALVQHFTKTLGVDYTYIGLVNGDNQEAIKTIAACAKGQIIDNFEYLLRDTPCQKVIQKRKLCCYPSAVQVQFPKAPLLEPLAVESYVAMPFFDSTGTPLGLLGIMDGKPLVNIQLAESLLTIFALRIATELERQQTEVARQQVQHELEHLVAQRTAELSKANELLHLEIAERQQAEAALQKEQEMLKVLLDNVQAGIVACNAEGILTLFNQVAREFHGLSEQPLSPDQWTECYDLYMPDGKTRMPKEEIPLFRALQGETVDNVEMVIAPQQGTTRTLLASGQAIFNSQGKKQGAVVVMHDITERKQVEAERAQLIREQTARLEAEANQRQSAFLVEVSTVLASALDYERTLVNVAHLVVPFFADWCAIDLLQPNQSIERVAVAHCAPEKVEFGWQLHQQYPQHINAAEGVPKILRTGQTEMAVEIPDTALEAVAQDAEHLRILRELGLKSCIVSPLIARGQILGAISFVMAESNRRYSQADLALAENIAHQVAIAIDNTRLYQAEQNARSEAVREAARSAEANRIKDEFLAVLSHELRSPLNPILGWSKLLQNQKHDPATLIRGLQTIERNAKLQTQLIEDLLDVSRILQGKLNLNVALVDLKPTIEAAMETVRLAAEAKAIQIQTQFNSNVGYVWGDADRLQQVVWNLLSNAVKFTPESGRVTVRLSMVNRDSLRQTVEHSQTTNHQPTQLPTTNYPLPTSKFAQIQVSDTGKGITPEFLPYIFERFRQADSKTTRQFGGLGLGLAIVRQLVELHGGIVDVDSAGEGQGATFTVRLPLMKDKVRTVKDEKDSLHPAAFIKLPLQGVRVLVVDDETDARELLDFILKQAGAIITSVASAIEALQALTHLEIDLLISDIGMPDMDGYMLMQQLRTLPQERGGQIPAIALTAYAGEINQQQVLAAGFQQHVTKPVEPAQLIKVIADLIKDQRHVTATDPTPSNQNH